MKRLLTRLLAGCVIFGITLAAATMNSISVEETGSGDPIVFLPGLGCPGSVWKAVAALLPGRRKILVSIHGFGGVPGRQTDFAAVRDSVAQLIREKHWHNVLLVGHSFGGDLALSLAAHNPGLFARVVILDAYPFPAAMLKPGLTAEEARGMAQPLRAMLMSLSDEQWRAQQAQMLRMMITSDQNYRTVLEWMVVSDRTTVAEAQFEAVSTDLRPLLPRIECPLLVLGSWRGRESMGFSHASVETALTEQYRGAPRCRIEISDSARHFLLLDDPDWVARRIASFIRQ